MISVIRILLMIWLFTSAILAQDMLDEQYRIADSLYKNEKYFDSITELKRLMFFDKEGRYPFRASLLIGECYRQGGKFTDALIWFTKAEMSTGDSDSLKYAMLQKVKINIIRRNTVQALNEIDQIYKTAGDSSQCNYWKGWAYIFNDEWEKAADHFSRSSKGNELELFSRETSSKLYNRNLAKILSYIIPGAGQIYTGHYINGILSLGWNVLWGYTAIRAFEADRIFDGIAVATLLWSRFYTGNFFNAEKFAIEENRKISDEALSYLEKNYLKEKP